MVTTADFPQADRLEQVGQVAIAISQGKQSDEDIENSIGLSSRGRQGRYYRLAAEILGLITNQHNHAVLTPLGNEFVSLSSAPARREFLARCLVETPVFHHALRYIHTHQPSKEQLKRWFYQFYPGEESTAQRRFHTFKSYLADAGLLQVSDDNKTHLQKYIGSVIAESPPSVHGLVGHQFDPSNTPMASNAEGYIRIDVDARKRERANQIHWNLVDGKSSFLNQRQLTPYINEHIDLYATAGKETVLYEMKSVTPEGTNLLTQIRKAISQLYEYRYIYQQPSAHLCIVTNHPIAKKEEWLLDYLATDRAIAYEWTNDFVNFECREDAASILGGFAP